MTTSPDSPAPTIPDGTGARIKARRKELGLTQKRVAQEVAARVDRDYTDGWLAQIERGKASLLLNAAIALADVLDMSMDEMFGRSGTWTGENAVSPRPVPADGIVIRQLKDGDSYLGWDGAEYPVRRSWTTLVAERDGEELGWACFRRFRDAEHLDEEVSEPVDGPLLTDDHRRRILYLASLYVRPGARRTGVMSALLDRIRREKLPVYGAFRNWWLRTWMQIQWAVPGRIPDADQAWAFRQGILDDAKKYADELAAGVAALERASRDTAAQKQASADFQELAKLIGVKAPLVVQFGYGIRLRFKFEHELVEASRMLHLGTSVRAERSAERDAEDDAEKSIEVLEALRGVDHLRPTLVHGRWRDPLGNDFWADGAMEAYYRSKWGR